MIYTGKDPRWNVEYEVEEKFDLLSAVDEDTVCAFELVTQRIMAQVASGEVFIRGIHRSSDDLYRYDISDLGRFAESSTLTDNLSNDVVYTYRASPQ